MSIQATAKPISAEQQYGLKLEKMDEVQIQGLRELHDLKERVAEQSQTILKQNEKINQLEQSNAAMDSRFKKLENRSFCSIQ